MLHLRTVIGGLLVGALVCSGAPGAHAEVQPEFSGRLGYGLPLGKLADGANTDIKDGVVGQIPFWLDAGARIGGHWFVGGYFSYGFGIMGSELSDACDALEAEANALGIDSSCHAQDTRLGLELLYHLATPREQRIDPWFGGGFGYEWFGWSYGLSAGTQHVDVNTITRGFEFVNLQLGVDFPLSETAAIGPFFAFSLGEYAKASLECSGDCAADAPNLSEDIHGRALHQWLFFGVRATLPL